MSLNWVGLAFFSLELNIAINSIPYFYYDNISANYMIVNSIFHGQTKHIKIDFHFVKKKCGSQNSCYGLCSLCQSAC